MAEIRDLKWKDIQNDRLLAHRKKTGHVINNRLNSTALKVIGERKYKDDYIFDVQSISVEGVNKNVFYWTLRANLNKHITFYCARHRFTCLLLMNGANLKIVVDAMGHRSTKNTLKYLNYVQKLQDEAIDNLSALEL